MTNNFSDLKKKFNKNYIGIVLTLDLSVVSNICICMFPMKNLFRAIKEFELKDASNLCSAVKRLSLLT